MGLLSLTEIIKIIKKYFLQITALALAAGILGGYAVTAIQTYTCTLAFKFNHSGAAEGLAPDGESKLDPYEIQNPVVIQAALNNMGITEDNDLNAKGIRQNISISKVVTELDKEVSESAALLGEKYDVNATEYEMKFTYKAALGDEFGSKMFSNIIQEYDEYLLAKYYNKKSIENFALILEDSEAEYIVIADKISSSLDSIVAYLDEMTGYYPNFRSTVTGYTFSDLSALYQNLRDIQHAKYYGNIRAGNLAKDREMVIKSYQTKVKDLKEDMDVNYHISENYKHEIKTFYDSYKASGLYRQAQQVRDNVDVTNNRDQDVIEDVDLEDYTNTYDEIILSYSDHAGKATDALHTINHYNKIIDSYTNDTVDEATKNKLLSKNKVILDEIKALSLEYSDIANKTIGELFATEVNNDLQYLIIPEVTADKPVKLIAVFLVILVFGMAMISVLAFELIKKFVDTDQFKAAPEEEESKIIIDTKGMDELHRLLYQQYLNDFDEFYLVYQPMISSKNIAAHHAEVFIRWQNSKLGLVSPGKIIECVSDFGIFRQLNDWIIKTVCQNLALRKEREETLPVVHINCPYSQINDFALNDIILKHISEYNIPPHKLCFELEGKDITQSLEDIMLLEDMGIKICIDKFENSDEDLEIINVVKPKYIKMSLDILNNDIYAISDDDISKATESMLSYFSGIIEQCHNNGIKACICGIEKKSQDEMATQIGFDFKQGYYYGKPEKYE